MAKKILLLFIFISNIVYSQVTLDTVFNIYEEPVFLINNEKEMYTFNGFLVENVGAKSNKRFYFKDQILHGKLIEIEEEQNKDSTFYSIVTPFINRKELIGYAVIKNDIYKQQLFDSRGVIIVNDTYENISELIDDYIIIKKNDKEGLIKMDENLAKLPIEYESIISFDFRDTDEGGGGFKKNILTKRSNLEWSLVDFDSIKPWERFVIKAKDISVRGMYNTNYNLIVHYENDKYNIINFKGEKKLLEDYDEITIAYVYYEYYLIRKGNKYGVIDGKGNFIIPINYNFIEFEGYPDNAKIQLKKEDKIMEFKLEKIRKNYFSKGLMLNK